MPIITPKYTPPKFFKNPYLQTLYSVYLRQAPIINYKREKILTPDKDFLYLDWLPQNPKRLAILTHGLTGDSQTRYMRGMAQTFAENNWSVLAWNMRGRGGQTSNWNHKNFHLGFTDDIRFIIDEAIKRGYEDVFLIGFSMGANIQLKYLGEEKHNIKRQIKGSIAVSAPIELVSCGEKIDHPSHKFFSIPLLKQMIGTISSKLSILSKHIDIDRLLQVRSWKEFDEIYTTPIFGFDSVLDYRQKASSCHDLKHIQIPTLLLNAKDDPMLSEECFPENDLLKNHPFLFGEFPQYGGHLGFVNFDKNGKLWSEERCLEFAESFT